VRGAMAEAGRGEWRGVVREMRGGVLHGCAVPHHTGRVRGRYVDLRVGDEGVGDEVRGGSGSSGGRGQKMMRDGSGSLARATPIEGPTRRRRSARRSPSTGGRLPAPGLSSRVIRFSRAGQPPVRAAAARNCAGTMGDRRIMVW
jgi:hypothetical protein